MDMLIDCYHELCFNGNIVPPGTMWIRGQPKRRMQERHISFIAPQTFCEYCHDLAELSHQTELTDKEQERLRECQEHVRIRDEQRKKYEEEGNKTILYIESHCYTEFTTSRNVKIWSDSGPKHFKNSHALYAIAQLAKKHKVSCCSLCNV